MRYTDLPSIHTVFSDGLPPLPMDAEFTRKVAAKREQILQAFRDLVTATQVHGGRGQIARNAFMLSGFVDLARNADPAGIGDLPQAMFPLWNQIWNAYANGPYSSEPMGPMDSIEADLTAYWPNNSWLELRGAPPPPVGTMVIAGSGSEPTRTVQTVTNTTPVVNPTHTEPDATIFGFSPLTVAAVAVLGFFVFSK